MSTELVESPDGPCWRCALINIHVPFGAVGELVVEGTTLALGYLDDSARTQAAFIRDPPWLLRGCGVEAISRISGLGLTLYSRGGCLTGQLRP